MRKGVLLFIIIISVVACNSSKKEENKYDESDEQIVQVNKASIEKVNLDNYQEENIKPEIAKEIIPDVTEEVSIIEDVKNEIVQKVESKSKKKHEIITKKVVIEAEETIDTSTQVKPQPIVKKEVIKKIVEKQEVVSVFDNKLWSALLKKYVNSNGDVNYTSIKNNEVELTAFLNQLIKTTPESSWTKNEKLAYWINAYNAFTVKLIVDNYPLKSIKDIKSPWDKKFISYNGKLISLNHIEHEILRKMNEPRIHFAINCASISCPKLLNSAFESNTMNSQLNRVSKSFINNSEKNRLNKDEVKISKIFKWFNKDFEKKGTIIDFLNKFSEIKINPKAKIEYLDYDWNLNKQ